MCLSDRLKEDFIVCAIGSFVSPLLIVSLICSVTLLVSGVAKARDYVPTATAIFNLKIDKWLPIRVKTAAKILPWAEIALGVSLLILPGIFQVLAAVITLVLFVFYWVVIARALMSGNDASCNCFGGASTAPISRWTLARNTALVLAAVVTVAGALAFDVPALALFFALDARDWFWLLGAALAVATLWFIHRADASPATAAQTSSAVGSSRVAASATSTPSTANAGSTADVEDSNGATGAVLDDAQELDDYVRLPIPFGALKTRSGSVYNLRELASSQARVLLWVSPTCGPCIDVIEQIPTWHEKLPMLGVHPVVASEEFSDQMNLPAHITVFVDEGYATQASFGNGTPMAIALGVDGLMAGGPVFGSGSVKEFMRDLMFEFDIEENKE